MCRDYEEEWGNVDREPHHEEVRELTTLLLKTKERPGMDSRMARRTKALHSAPHTKPQQFQHSRMPQSTAQALLRLFYFP